MKGVIKKCGIETIECKIKEKETEIIEDNVFTLIKLQFFCKKKNEK